MTFTAVVKEAFSTVLLGKAAYQPLIALAIFLDGFFLFLKKLENRLRRI
jgi:hypothetical protein